MVDNPVHHGMVCKEGDDSHLAAALGTEERVNLIDFKSWPSS